MESNEKGRKTKLKQTENIISADFLNLISKLVYRIF